MVRIREGKKYEYQASPKIEIDPFVMPETDDEITATAHEKAIFEIMNGMDEYDARIACRALVAKWPGLYFNALVKEYADKAAKLEAIGIVMKGM